jgi:hypothetical protein
VKRKVALKERKKLGIKINGKFNEIINADENK